MKNKKGFTLVELLAVIVLLAAVMILVYPNVLEKVKEQDKGIDEKKKQLLYTSVYDYLYENKAAYPLTTGKNYCVSIRTLAGNDKLYVDDYGDLLDTGYVQVQIGEGGDVHQDKNAYRILSDGSTCIGDTVVDLLKYNNGDIIYFNPETGRVCSDYTIENSKTGIKNGCMKWYTFNDSKDSVTVNMILDHNTTAKVAWNSTRGSVEMKEAAIALTNDTSTWNSKFSPRLIEAKEIANITGNTSFTLTSPPFFLDSNNQNQTVSGKGASKYSWLFDYTRGCIPFGCNVEDNSSDGYWTASHYPGSAGSWLLVRGYLTYNYSDDTSRGIRPVITVPKSFLQ